MSASILTVRQVCHVCGGSGVVDEGAPCGWCDGNGQTTAAHRSPAEPKCDHGVTFDVEEAKRILANGTLKHPKDIDPAVAFIMGDPNTTSVRKRFPRLFGECPKGCGYNGIAYASMEHYLYGDW